MDQEHTFPKRKSGVCSAYNLNPKKTSISLLLPTTIKSDSDEDKDKVISSHTMATLNSFRYSNVQSLSQLPPLVLPLKNRVEDQEYHESLGQDNEFYPCRSNGNFTSFSHDSILTFLCSCRAWFLSRTTLWTGCRTESSRVDPEGTELTCKYLFRPFIPETYRAAGDMAHM